MKPTLTKILAASGAVLLLAGWGVQAATATPQTDDTANTVTEDTSAAVSMEEAKTRESAQKMRVSTKLREITKTAKSFTKSSSSPATSNMTMRSKKRPARS